MENNMKILKEEKIITLNYERLVLDDGFVFSSVSDVLGILEALEMADGFMNTVVFSNVEDNEMKKLEDMKVIRKNNRGSYYWGNNYRSFYSDLYKLIYNETLLF